MQIRTILVPVDFSDDSAKALDMAIELAQRFGAKLELIHCLLLQPGPVAPYAVVYSPPLQQEVQDAADTHVQNWVEKVRAAGVEASGGVSSLVPTEGIVGRAKKIGADLIVMGTQGHTGIKHAFLGSVAERTVRLAPCPVLTVKA